MHYYLYLEQPNSEDKEKLPDRDKLAEALQTFEVIAALKFSLIDSMHLFRVIGYGLLILSLFDLIDTFIPPRFMDPLWEFQTLVVLVGRAPVPLLGLLLVFYGRGNWRSKWELPLLKVLSWGTLLAGVGYLLLVPLGVVDTMRFDIYNNNQVSQQLSQKVAQIDQLKGQLEAVSTEAQMQPILRRIQDLPPSIKEIPQLGEKKQKLSQFIAEGEKKLKQEAEQVRSQKRLELLKQSVKSILGALVSGVLFIFFWSATDWTRSPYFSQTDTE